MVSPNLEAADARSGVHVIRAEDKNQEVPAVSTSWFGFYIAVERSRS
jgi:hypothetical protein